MTEELAALIERYRRTLEFMLADLTDVNSMRTGDTLLHSAFIRASTEDVDCSSDRVTACGMGKRCVSEVALCIYFGQANECYRLVTTVMNPS